MDVLEINILRKLLRHKYIGGRHTSIESAIRGIPKHMSKQARQAVNSLIKRGYLMSHPTNYGLQIAVNPKKLKEILDLLKL